MAESFMKTLKVEAVYLAAYETFEDVTATFRDSSTRSTTPDAYTPHSAISTRCNFEDQHAQYTVKAAA